MDGKHGNKQGSSLVIGDGLDIKSKCRADNAGILPINFQNDGCFPRVVEASERQSTVNPTE